MTTREFLNALTLEGELEAKRLELISKLDEKNAKRASKPTKTQEANEPIKAAILAYVEANPKAVASDIGKALDISTQKASALAFELVKAGALTREDIKVKGKGTVKGYSVAVAEAE